MSRINNALFALGAFFVLFFSAAGASYAQNTKPSPTPTPTPTVNANIINTPSVTVTNTPDVNIANAPDVKVTNTPRTLNANDLQPFQLTKQGYTSGTSLALTFSVPAGKRLVIEYVSVRVVTTVGEEAEASITTFSAPDYSGTQHRIVLSPQRTTSGNQYFDGAQPVKMYQEASDFSILAIRSNPSGGPVAGNLNITASVSGYLVDVQ